MTDRFSDLFTARSVMRLLLLSYFVAVALNLIGGTELAGLFRPLMPTAVAGPLTLALVLGLSAMVLSGVGRRVGALLLSLVVFFASYIALYEGADIAAFWRDLALVGGLLLTADIARTEDDEQADPHDIEIEAERAPGHSEMPAPPRDAAAFREDFDAARTG